MKSSMRNFKKQLYGGILNVISGILIYLILTAILNRVFNIPIFLLSILLSLTIPIATLLIYYKITKLKVYDYFSYIMLYFCSTLSILFFAIFGPVFIDRSLSYHMIFYIEEQQTTNINDIYKLLSDQSSIDSRIKDAKINVNDNNEINADIKTNIIYNLLFPIGKITNTLNHYKDIKENVIKYKK
ncbi:MAG: hypothetical protein LBQ34_03170 [Alphaproteobacteria bacterium]|jgi:hypothetical protein|nr:hypothetical protein [Alphaproteobacteria bacterium]